MELNSGQLSTLNEMGIPVWELRANNSVELTIVNDEPTPIELLEQQLQSNCFVMFESQDNNEQAQRLLQSMLMTIGLPQEKLAIVTSAQLPQLQNLSLQKRVLFVLGSSLAQSALGDTVIRGKTHITLDSEFTTVVSFSLEELLNSPKNKALAWQDLQLVKASLSL